MYSNFRMRYSHIGKTAFALMLTVVMALSWIPAQAGTPMAVDSQAQSDSVETISEAKGIIEKMPRLLFFGKWEVAGNKYVATLLTQFDQRDGPIVEGACVNIQYSEDANPHRLTRVTALEEEECTPNNDDDMGDDDMGDDDMGDDDMDQDGGTVVIPSARAYGRITSLPESDDLQGVWGVDETDYYVNEHTEFKRKHGDFEQESCVKVKYGVTDDGYRVATRIETVSKHRCKSNEEERPSGTLYGVIQSVPEQMIGQSESGELFVRAATTGMTGEYNIGGKTFTADENTKFKEKRNVKIEIGVVAKVKFVVLEDDTYLATSIKALRKAPGHELPDDGDDGDNGDNDDGGDNGDDGNDGDYGDNGDNETPDGLRGHSFGEIESFPAELIGEWKVSGITFTSTAQTSYIQRRGAFAAGSWVRVNYVVNADGERIATVIKTIQDRGNGNHKFCGYLNGRPASGFIGPWLVDNFEGITNLATVFDETLGIFGSSAYVEVDYTVNDDGSVTYNLVKAHVPPGAGDNDAIGAISRIGDEAQAAAVAADETWVIGGKTYLVTAATEIDESQGQLEVGDQVAVNSYTTEDGTEVATSIGVATVGSTVPMLYLPMIY